MPITWITSLIGSLALIGTPFFSGFYSKDSIIVAVEHSSQGWVSSYAHWAVLAGVFVTAFYSFRMYFLVFHGEERFRHKPFPAEQDHSADDAHGHGEAKDDHAHGVDHAHAHEPHESPAVVWVPLVLLAIPSLVIGGIAIGSMLGGHYFDGSIFVNLEKHPAMEAVMEEAHNALHMGWHAFATLPFWLALAGVAAAAFLYFFRKPSFALATGPLGLLRKLLDNKYFFDWINENIIARASRGLGSLLWNVGDKAIIDGAAVNGSALAVGWLSGIVRRVQTGFLYSYAFWMVIGLALLLGWFLVGRH
jgi:NADH-quinone oxidoreductase subunit L